MPSHVQSALRITPTPKKYRERPPSAELAGTVDLFWGLDPNPGQGLALTEVLPDGNVDLLIILSPSDCRIHLFGPATRPMVVARQKEHTLIGVRFLPGMAPRLANVSHADLLDTHLRLDSLCGVSADELGERLAALPDASHGGRLIQTLLRQANPRPMTNPLCRRASAHILDQEGSVKVSALAQALDTSTRSLERSFLADLGLSPKSFLRLVRLHKTALALRTPNPDYAGLAQDCGFADQAHMVREFRELAGKTPTMVSDSLRNMLVVTEPPIDTLVHHIA
jgi:AraC-like DNA-binding protein